MKIVIYSNGMVREETGNPDGYVTIAKYNYYPAQDVAVLEAIMDSEHYSWYDFEKAKKRLVEIMKKILPNATPFQTLAAITSILTNEIEPYGLHEIKIKFNQTGGDFPIAEFTVKINP